MTSLWKIIIIRYLNNNNLFNKNKLVYVSSKMMLLVIYICIFFYCSLSERVKGHTCHVFPYLHII